MGNTQCCAVSTLDPNYELNPKMIKYQQSQKKEKNGGHNLQQEHSTTVNLSNYNYSDTMEAEGGNIKKKKYDIYEEEDFNSEIMKKVVKMNKQPSFFQDEMKQKYIILKSILKQQKINEKTSNNILGDALGKMMGREYTINQQSKNAKSKLENFLQSFSQEFYILNKFEIWFNEQWYEDEEEIVCVVKDMVTNIPPYLKQLVLNFWGMKIGIEGSRQMSKCLKKQKQLLYLDLNIDTGNVGNIGASQLAHALGIQTHLQELKLNLSNNDLNEVGVQKLIKGLSKIKSLKSLDLLLQNNRGGLSGGEEMVNCIQQLVKLNKLNLNLQGNKIGDNGVNQIIQQICQLPVLSELYIGLSDNDITDSCLEKMKKEFLNLDKKKMTKLIIGINDNSGISDKIGQATEQELKNKFPDITFYLFY